MMLTALATNAVVCFDGYISPNTAAYVCDSHGGVKNFHTEKSGVLCRKDHKGIFTCRLDGNITFVGKMYEKNNNTLGYVEGVRHYENGDSFTGTYYENDSYKSGIYSFSDGDSYNGTYFHGGLKDTGEYKISSGEVKHIKSLIYKAHDIGVQYKNTGIKYENGDVVYQTREIIVTVTGEHYVEIPTKSINIKAETVDGKWSYATDWRNDYESFIRGRISFTQGAIDREVYALESKQPDNTYKVVKSYKQYSNGRKKNTFDSNKRDVLQVIINRPKNIVKVSKSRKITKHTKYIDLERKGLFCDIGKLSSVCEGALSENEYLKYEFNHALGSLIVTREKGDSTYVVEFKIHNE